MKPCKTFFLLMTAAPLCHALEEANDINVELSIASQLSDNGARVNDDVGLAEKERQDIYGISTDFTWANEWSNIAGNYSLDRWLYSEDFQSDYDSINGNIKFNLGAEYQIPHLEISHSNKSLLVSPDALDVSSNRSQRSITTIEPSLRLGLQEANMFQASISASKIQYKKQSSTDSTLEGAQLMWIHKISPVDTFRLMAQTNKTEFESDPSLDYKLETVSASYSVNLNHLSYGLSVGQNKATQDKNNDSFSRPNYNLNVNYVSPLYTAKLTFAQRISNSSAGDGNSEGFIDTSLDSINAGLDLINIKSGGLLFSTSIICERCTLTAALENNREDYKTLNEDSDLRKVSTSFRYIVGRNGALQLSYNELKRTFDTQAERDYLRKEYEISYSHNYIKKVDMKLFARRNFNDSERLYNKYEENIVGLVVSYSL